MINDPAQRGLDVQPVPGDVPRPALPPGHRPLRGLDGRLRRRSRATTSPTRGPGRPAPAAHLRRLARRRRGGSGYPNRIVDGVYQLPGNTAFYGADANGTALVGPSPASAPCRTSTPAAAPGKLVYDAAVIADPEIDFSDYDTDKDGVVDFFMAVFAGCGGNGGSQLGAAGCEYADVPYDNVWPHSSSLEFYYTDPDTGLPGYTTDDQLKDLEGRPLWYTDRLHRDDHHRHGRRPKVFVRVGPYNVNPETAIDKASVISHEYGHSLGLPDFYSLGSRETYGDWNLMATDKSQNMDVFSRQELGWVVPEVLEPGTRTASPAGPTPSRTPTPSSGRRPTGRRTRSPRATTAGCRTPRPTSPSCPGGSCSTRPTSTPATPPADPRLVVGVRQRLRLRAQAATTSTSPSPSWPTLPRAARSSSSSSRCGTSSGTTTTATC